MEKKRLCDIINTDQINKIREQQSKDPLTEYWFNTSGDCLIYEDRKLIGVERKNGSYIDKRINPQDKD